MSVCLGRGSCELMAPGLGGEIPKDPSSHPRDFVGHLPPLPHSSLTPLSLLLLGPQSESWEGDCHPCEGLGGLWGRCWKEVGGSLQVHNRELGAQGQGPLGPEEQNWKQETDLPKQGCRERPREP